MADIRCKHCNVIQTEKNAGERCYVSHNWSPPHPPPLSQKAIDEWFRGTTIARNNLNERLIHQCRVCDATITSDALGIDEWKLQHYRCIAAPSVEREAVLPGDCACRYWARSFQMDMNYECSLDLHHPNCDGFGGHKSGIFDESKISAEAFANTANDHTPSANDHTPSTNYVHVDMDAVQLLVIDAGDCCFLHIEVGRYDMKLFDDDIGGMGYRIIQHPFSEVRAAIDAIDAAPLPRIEKELMADKYPYYRVYFNDTSFSLSLNPFDALSELVGEELPIYSPKPGGEWKQLGKQLLGKINNGDTFELTDELPVKIYRFTR